MHGDYAYSGEFSVEKKGIILDIRFILREGVGLEGLGLGWGGSFDRRSRAYKYSSGGTRFGNINREFGMI